MKYEYALISAKSWLGSLRCDFRKFITDLWPLTDVKIRFLSISGERIDGFRLNFAYALILTRSRLVLLHVNFCKFMAELWSLIDVRNSFPLSILSTNSCISTKFC